MHHLFSVQGEAALSRFMARGPLLAFDFDGTLTPIVARPGDARLSRTVSLRLQMLAARLPLAIVTGRSVEDLRQRLGFKPSYLVGNHGAEFDEGDEHSPVRPELLDALRTRLAARRDILAAAGVTVEDKRLSIALHYRLSSDATLAQEVIAEVLDEAGDTIQVFGGKRVVNAAPHGAPDKAKAVQALLGRSGRTCALFAGDDVNDEPVFAAAPPDWLTLRVGRDAPRSAARYFLDSPSEMGLLLDRMLRLLG